MARISDKTRGLVIALLYSGETQAEAAKRAGISVRSVERIAASIRDELNRFRKEQKHDLDQLLLDYVAETLTTLKVLLQEIRRPEFIRAQKARDLGILLGICSDKAFRVLSATIRSDSGAEEEAGEEADKAA